MNSILTIDVSATALFVIASIALLLVILVASLVLLRAFKLVLKLTAPELEQQEKESKKLISASETVKLTFWQKVLGLRPIEEEEDLLIDHSYDGIQELDNPTPVWFNALFYSTIVFAIGYLLVYHVFEWGMNQEQEYLAEIELAEKQRVAFLESSGTNIDENTVTLDLSPAMVTAGQEIYLQNCSACHGSQGEGMIGPNLTDEYWLHGGDIKDIFRVIKYGVPDKGMVPWESNLTPVQISQVSNFIASISGTTPPNAKEPQGDKYEASTPTESTATSEVEL